VRRGAACAARRSALDAWPRHDRDAVVDGEEHVGRRVRGITSGAARSLAPIESPMN
jgi:hypothetical protein